MITASAEPAADRLLSALGWRGALFPRVLVVVAHPDDETIGIGGHLPGLRGVQIVHATDGAPRDLADARAYGFRDASGYAGARQQELQTAMALAGVEKDALTNLGFADQQTAHSLVALARSFSVVLSEAQPDMVFTHAYEGGHPDHDAVAFAARAARRLASSAPVLVEMPFYRAEKGALVRQGFAISSAPHLAVALDAQAQERKRRMLACHATQRETLAGFGVEQECFRLATPCDMSRPPNGGDLYYERFAWNCSGAQFQANAAQALSELGLEPWL